MTCVGLQIEQLLEQARAARCVIEKRGGIRAKEFFLSHPALDEFVRLTVFRGTSHVVDVAFPSPRVVIVLRFLTNFQETLSKIVGADGPALAVEGSTSRAVASDSEVQAEASALLEDPGALRRWIQEFTAFHNMGEHEMLVALFSDAPAGTFYSKRNQPASDREVETWRRRINAMPMEVLALMGEVTNQLAGAAPTAHMIRSRMLRLMDEAAAG